MLSCQSLFTSSLSPFIGELRVSVLSVLAVVKAPRERDADSIENQEAAAAIVETSREASPSETRFESGHNLASVSGGEGEGDASPVEGPKGPSRLKANLYVAQGLVRNVGGKAKGWMQYIAGDG